jgi:hypothetical protein
MRLGLAIPVSVLLVFVGCSGTAGPEPAATANNSPTGAPVSATSTPGMGLPYLADTGDTAERVYISKMAPELQEAVRRQPWLEPPIDSDTLAVIASIAAASTAEVLGLPAAELDPSEVAAFVEGLGRLTWVGDGLNAGEKQTLTAAFDAVADYSAVLGVHKFREHADLERWLREQHLHWQPVQEALARRTFEVLHRPNDRPLTVFAIGPEEEARRALQMTVLSVSAVESFASPYPHRSLAVVIDPPFDIGQALGQAYQSVVVLRREFAGEENVVVHELAHLHLQSLLPPPWLEEGMAAFMANYLAGDDLQDLSAGLGGAYDLRGLPTFLDCLGDPVAQERVERTIGLLFLLDVYDLSGVETVSRMAKAMRANHFITVDAIAQIRSYMPEQKKFEFDALTAKRFRNLGRYCPALSPD